MKAKTQTTPDTRVWCEQCCIRIAPSEERVVQGDKVYHQHCSPKPKPARKATKK